MQDIIDKLNKRRDIRSAVPLGTMARTYDRDIQQPNKEMTALTKDILVKWFGVLSSGYDRYPLYPNTLIKEFPEGKTVLWLYSYELSYFLDSIESNAPLATTVEVDQPDEYNVYPVTIEVPGTSLYVPAGEYVVRDRLKRSRDDRDFVIVRNDIMGVNMFVKQLDQKSHSQKELVTSSRRGLNRLIGAKKLTGGTVFKDSPLVDAARRELEGALSRAYVWYVKGELGRDCTGLFADVIYGTEVTHMRGGHIRRFKAASGWVDTDATKIRIPVTSDTVLDGLNTFADVQRYINLWALRTLPIGNSYLTIRYIRGAKGAPSSYRIDKYDPDAGFTYYTNEETV